MSDPRPGGGWALRRHLSLETACGLEEMKTVRVCCGLRCKYWRGGGGGGGGGTHPAPSALTPLEPSLKYALDGGSSF